MLLHLESTTRRADRVLQGSIDRLREQKGDSAMTTAAASAPPSGASLAPLRWLQRDVLMLDCDNQESRG